MNDIDILHIDLTIRNKFKEDNSKLHEYIIKEKELKKLLRVKHISVSVTNKLEKELSILRSKIKDIETRHTETLYLAKTVKFVSEYKELLKKPVKLSFTGKKIRSEDTIKNEIIRKYIEIANLYGDTYYKIPDSPKGNHFDCNNCKNKKRFEVIDGNIYICTECSSQQVIMKQTSCYNDIDRVNISTKYSYNRKVHFRDCINQYQGKQNCTIPHNVYTELEKQFELHHILIGNKDTPKHIRFKNLTKKHIHMFLKEPLGYSKHYENIHLIHYMFTGKKPDDIGHLEHKLLEDFDTLNNLYDQMYKGQIERKNFINNQYVLYQLLKRYKHPCRRDDFVELKTNDKKVFHDNITKELFTQLNWNYFPYF